MRSVLCALLVTASCAGAFWNDYTPPRLLRTHERWSTIDDNRRECKVINDEIQRVILLQRTAHDASEHRALEQRFLDLIKDEQKLKKDQYNLIKEATQDWRI